MMVSRGEKAVSREGEGGDGALVLFRYTGSAWKRAGRQAVRPVETYRD